MENKIIPQLPEPKSPLQQELLLLNVRISDLQKTAKNLSLQVLLMEMQKNLLEEENKKLKAAVEPIKPKNPKNP